MKFGIWAAVVASVMTASMAGDSLASEGPTQDNRAHAVFLQSAKTQDIAAAFPKAAFDRRITGEVALDCTADTEGRLTDCRVDEESPTGQGFGQAALSLTGKERVKTTASDGAAIAGRRFTSTYTFLAPGDANPDWMKKPSAADLAGAFPKAAARKGVDGKAILRCQLSVEGFLQKCAILSEQPEGLGFGDAALALTPQFRMTPKIRGGKPTVDNDLTIPVIWQGFANYTPPTSPGHTLLLDPPWESTPSAAQVRAAWPAKAKDAANGQVALRCELNKTGGLTDCLTISEIPANRGFAKAAQSLTPYFKVRFAPEQAKTLSSYKVDVPFRFRDPATPDARALTKPKWTKVLTADGMAMAYPKAALAAHVTGGLGAVDCTIGVHGELKDCKVHREEPTGLGFGVAAIEAATLMAMNPWSKEGEPLDGLGVTVPIKFQWDDSPAPPPNTPAVAKP